MWHGWTKQRVCDHCGHKQRSKARFCARCERLIAWPPSNRSSGRKRTRRPHATAPALFVPDSQEDGTPGDMR